MLEKKSALLLFALCASLSFMFTNCRFSCSYYEFLMNKNFYCILYLNALFNFGERIKRTYLLRKRRILDFLLICFEERFVLSKPFYCPNGFYLRLLSELSCLMSFKNLSKQLQNSQSFWTLMSTMT